MQPDSGSEVGLRSGLEAYLTQMTGFGGVSAKPRVFAGEKFCTKLSMMVARSFVDSNFNRSWVIAQCVSTPSLKHPNCTRHCLEEFDSESAAVDWEVKTREPCTVMGPSGQVILTVVRLVRVLQDISAHIVHPQIPLSGATITTATDAPVTS
jgi:hypothetical protein